MNTHQKGHLHPLSRAILEIRAIFGALGFEIALGPEIETEWHNFDALNIPADHPARDMQDTFWLQSNQKVSSTIELSPLTVNSQKSKVKSDRRVLRTHTSPVQIRYMEEKVKAGINPPYRIIVPGKIFRNEATDATHEAQFFQVEGLYVDREVSMAHLKGALLHFLKKFFNDENIEVRFRPSYFSFTEPSAEVDMLYRRQSASNPRESAWLEMGGAGLVHPNVLRNVGLDPRAYSGFAFGMGLDRLVMLKYGIPDIRMFYSGDLRLVNQF
ncbi:MAG: phenylalanine--tRNA ligase subunit alpha [Patescibacteria group bacterium]